MIFNRFNEPVKKDEPKMKISLLEALQGNMKKTAGMGGGLGMHFRSKIAKELQKISIQQIKDVLMNEPKSERSELFQLLCGFTIQVDDEIQTKIKNKVDHTDQEIKLLYLF